MCKTQNQLKQPELADIFRLHGNLYRESNTLTPEQHKVMNAIMNCRTSVLGGHVDQCNQCGALQCSYNSCRNRHCPKCESFKAFRWLENKEAELLPVPYFHLVYTLPHELNTLIAYNKKILYDLLFQAAWQTLKTLGKDKKRLNGEMGMLAILHTWSQNLSQHNHLHCVVPGGALTTDGKWNPSSKKYLFPVKIMSVIFRGIYVTALKKLNENEQLKLPPSLTFEALLNDVMKKNWQVYAKEPFAGPEKLLNYLCRYTHKMAISNHRILACDADFVTFKWRDYTDNNKVKIMRLAPSEFIRRFLSHVVPDGFMRIRSFGFLSNACKKKKIAIIHEQLSYKAPKPKEKRKINALMFELTGKDISVCSICKQGTMIRINEMKSTLRVAINDSS